MNGRHTALTVAAALVVTILMPGVAGAQGTEVPRTPWGAPDLQGIWDRQTLTPFQRPRELGEKAVFTAEEAAVFESRVTEALAAVDVRVAPRDTAENNETAETIGNYNDFWFDAGATTVETRRTSLVFDPPDGRVPPLTAEAEEKQAALLAARAGVNRHEPTPGGFVDDLGPGRYAVRCLVGFNTGPPMVPGAYNQNVQVFQTEDTVVLFNEMIHDARVIPIDGRDRLDDGIRQWLGSPRARWEGDTLVIETTNFRGETSFMNGLSDANLHLTERLTRASETTLLYEVTVSDPSVWTQPWTYELPMKRIEGPLFEYACHEGNYGLYNILAGAAEQ
ncbi:MAG: hypothetical protein J4F30_10145 [Acidobacteria bacterium]|nr:hypothetical protein [Acidobacteriota bacterium]